MTASPRYLLDTNAFINSLASPAAEMPFLLPGDAQTVVSVVTELELRYGVAVAPHDPLRLGHLTHLLSRWTPVPVDAAVSASASAVIMAAVAAGQRPRKRMNDLMIAATALAHGMTLVTNDAGLSTAVSGLVRVQPLY